VPALQRRPAIAELDWRWIAGGIGGRVPESNVGSVYRNLERMQRVGIVRHVHLAHSPSLFTIATAGEREHLTCERCAEYVALEPTQLNEVRRAIRSPLGYAVRFSHVPIVGLCQRCAGVAGR
jgi:Fur family ferric uptake transcriptional regulator